MSTMNKKKSSNTNAKPFIAPGSDIAITQDEIDKRIIRVKKAEEIGQNITKVDSTDGYENPYSARALYYIASDMEVPEELRKKIKEFDKQHEIIKNQTARKKSTATQ